MTTDETMFAEFTEDDVVDTEFVEDDHELKVEKGIEPIALSIKEAALILGKSIRALERSLSGKWGNKLPDGWTSSKKIVDGEEEWQIFPPPGFRYEHLLVDVLRKEAAHQAEQIERINTDDLLRPIRALVDRPHQNEMTNLLRELANAQRELAEERKSHMQDMRTLLELQGSMRLLESNTSETAKLKAELLEAQKDLIGLRDQYREFLSLPWWKRIFRRKL